jgi:hypothetical protein
MARMMRPKVTYWTGLFRDFQLNSSTTIGSDTVCISVRRYDSGFFFDPSDCSELKHALCEKFFEQEIKDNVQTSESRPDLGKNTNSSCGTTVIVSLTFNGILFAVIMVGAAYVYSRRRIKTSSRYRVISGSGPETGTPSVYRIVAADQDLGSVYNGSREKAEIYVRTKSETYEQVDFDGSAFKLADNKDCSSVYRQSRALPGSSSNIYDGL